MPRLDDLQWSVGAYGEMEVYKKCKFCNRKKEQPFIQAEHSLARIQTRVRHAVSHVVADVERLSFVLTSGGSFPFGGFVFVSLLLLFGPDQAVPPPPPPPPAAGATACSAHDSQQPLGAAFPAAPCSVR